MKALLAILVLATVAQLGCKRELAELPIDNQIAHACYWPFFEAANNGDTEAIRATLSQETIRHHEQTVFPEGRVMTNWKDFTYVYEGMQMSKFVKDVVVKGDRAVITDQVGGTLKCVKEEGNWKVDLTP